MTTHRDVGSRIAEDLMGAAGVLFSEGWAQEALHADEGGHDLTGAIYVATGYHQLHPDGRWHAHPLRNSAGRRASEAIRWLAHSLPTNSVWEFNDLYCTTSGQAVAVLHSAAEAARRRVRTSDDVERAS